MKNDKEKRASFTTEQIQARIPRFSIPSIVTLDQSPTRSPVSGPRSSPSRGSTRALLAEHAAAMADASESDFGGESGVGEDLPSDRKHKSRTNSKKQPRTPRRSRTLQNPESNGIDLPL
eukprot:206603_1